MIAGVVAEHAAIGLILRDAGCSCFAVGLRWERIAPS